MKKWYVYAHSNPLTGETFYIGKGTGNRSLSKQGRNSKWYLYTEGLDIQGLSYTSSILHICDTEDEALDLERIEIHSRLKAGQALVNEMVPLKDIELQFNNTIINESNLEIASFIKRKRKAAKLSQVECADKLGVGLRFLREIEGGTKTNFRLDKVNQVLYAFGAVLKPCSLNKI